jgi:hypothetical protein
VADGNDVFIVAKLCKGGLRLYPYVDIGMTALEIRQMRGEEAGSKRWLGIDVDRIVAFAALDICKAIGHRVEGSRHDVEQLCPFLRQPDGSMTPIEERSIKQHFQLPHLTANGGLRDAELICGLGKAHEPSSSFETSERS